ncbi:MULTISPECIES: hypothetical protein [unclassified Legionella]|uniref:hypothetical protein n=1 Tax=unclassified Legionella TaxID=2622702 RepID=UPI001054C90D|nr:MULTISPECIES: hypothetical protein [unclassified Legionella]MDI9818191.1 hypothetical protein [Legionella sp. PL877]
MLQREASRLACDKLEGVVAKVKLKSESQDCLFAILSYKILLAIFYFPLLHPVDNLSILTTLPDFIHSHKHTKR